MQNALKKVFAKKHVLRKFLIFSAKKSEILKSLLSGALCHEGNVSFGIFRY
jgi:hypothetical protein